MVEMGVQTLQAPRFIGGATVVSGGLTITAGGLTVTAGGVTVTAGDLTMTAGDLSIGANSLKTTSMVLYESTTTRLDIRNLAKNSLRDLGLRTLFLWGNEEFQVDANFQTRANVAGYVDLKSYSGAAQVSCIKLVGGVAEIAAGKLTDAFNVNAQLMYGIGNLGFGEIAKPGDPPATQVYLYAKEKSTGLTALYALFDDGTEIEIAAEV
uniref:Uncharacterized protein n=1 Tax=viral metagenome TaxID=1070528 RepID=A0A6H2A2H8_9ZZZZ